MTMNEKEKLAKKIYKELGFEIEEFQTEKVEEIDADVFLPINNQKAGKHYVALNILPWLTSLANDSFLLKTCYYQK